MKKNILLTDEEIKNINLKNEADRKVSINVMIARKKFEQEEYSKLNLNEEKLNNNFSKKEKLEQTF